jgi:hypothetical protein
MVVPIIHLFSASPILMTDMSALLPFVVPNIMSVILGKGEAAAKGGDQSRNG